MSVLRLQAWPNHRRSGQTVRASIAEAPSFGSVVGRDFIRLREGSDHRISHPDRSSAANIEPLHNISDDQSVTCPLLTGPFSMKEEWNGKEAQAGRYHRQVG